MVVVRDGERQSLCTTCRCSSDSLDETGREALTVPTRSWRRIAQGLTRLTLGHPDLLRGVTAGVYDGDTHPATRRKLREGANVVLSNPDMLHQGILPSHSKWARFLGRLRYVVVDEVHAYRGIFGSHVANVLRRLDRLVAHHGGATRFVIGSATTQPASAESLVGRPSRSSRRRGAARREHFVFGTRRSETRGRARSSNGDARCYRDS